MQRALFSVLFAEADLFPFDLRRNLEAQSRE